MFLRVVLIVGISLIFGLVFFRPDYFFTQIITAILVIGLTVELIFFARRTNKELTKFILAIKYGDVSVNFSGDELGRDFKELAGSFREVIKAYNQVKIEKESQYQLLQAIIDKISFGIIAFNEEDEILLINKSALTYLRIAQTRDWKYIKKEKPEFIDQIENMASEGRKLVELGNGTHMQQLSVYNHAIVLMEKHCRVITFYDIKDEIEQKEIEAWYKLIRILTHEIMNSATPIVSLTETILMLLEDDNGRQKDIADLSDQNISDVRSSVNTIKKRSQGILQFVDAYRKLTDIPHPEMDKIVVKTIIESAHALLGTELETRKIKWITEVIPDTLSVVCDKNLIEQVLINLITNSMYALEGREQPSIKITAFDSDSRIVFQIEDNGKGIEEAALKKIFIPFFSTREGGSGIGLSFSKYVIHQHNGRIRVGSEKNKGTKFIIELPKQ
jgi:nitrogen fixation/metabolism regulation signal transduction histidine kinase